MDEERIILFFPSSELLLADEASYIVRVTVAWIVVESRLSQGLGICLKVGRMGPFNRGCRRRLFRVLDAL
jgi:hypothetical protein